MYARWWLFSAALVVSGCNEPIVARGDMGSAVSSVVARVMTSVAAAPPAGESGEGGDDGEPVEGAGDEEAMPFGPDESPSETGELGVYEEEPPVPDAAEDEAGAVDGGGVESPEMEAGESDVDGAYADANPAVYEESENAERIQRLEVDRDLMAMQIEALEAQVAALDQRVYDLEELGKLLFATVTTHQQRLASIQVALLAITAASGAR